MRDSSTPASHAKLPQKFFAGYPEVKETNIPGYHEQTTDMSLPYGHSVTKQWQFDGICMRHSVNRYNDFYTFKNENAEGVVTLGFSLKGNSVITQRDRVFRVGNLQHNIIYTNGYPNTFENKALESESLMIEFQPENFLRITENSNDYLKRFAESISGDLPVVLSTDSLIIRPELFRPLQDIISCHYSGKLKKIYLISKCLEILVIQAEAFNEICYKPVSVLKNRRDRDMIVDARDYLLQHVDAPPSLTELAKLSGINEYKLKKGFKEVFNTTVFGYLADYRLERARSELHNDKSVSEIAYELGYSSPQHFSYAFKKKFGLSPGQVKSK